MAKFNPITLVAGLAFGLSIGATVINFSQDEKGQELDRRLATLEKRFAPIDVPDEAAEPPVVLPKPGEVFEKKFDRATVREITVTSSPRFKRGESCALGWNTTYSVQVVDAKDGLVLVRYSNPDGDERWQDECVDGTVGVMSASYFDVFRQNLANDEQYGPEETAERERALAAFPTAER